MNFYSVIIGTELLNGRRRDKHFRFLNEHLIKRGWEQKASFVIKDEPQFIIDTFNFIKQDKDAVIFCFGGIGATPDDFTREAAAQAFTAGKMEINEDAKEAIIEQFGEQETYPHRINMAKLPIGAGLLKNVVTNVPGFFLDKRFFFVPGFPSMAESMVVEALDKYYPKNKQKYRYSLKADCGENLLIDTMKKLPKDLDFSSLPQINGDERAVIISIASYEQQEAKKYFNYFTDFLKQEGISYTLEDM